MDLEPTISLIDLPNCVLLNLFGFLDATTKYQLSKTCRRLEGLLKTPWLWKYIDARNGPNNNDKVQFCTGRIYNGSSCVFLRGSNVEDSVLPPKFFKNISVFEHLRILTLENQAIRAFVRSKSGNVRAISIIDFPEFLEELSLKRTKVHNAENFFRKSYFSKPNLRVLILDECQWVTNSTLMSLSRYKKLEILSVYKCRNLENEIPYISMSFCVGFNELKIFDARLTKLGNTLFRVLHNSKTILAVYLQNEDISYRLDVFKRKLALLDGAKPREFCLDDDTLSDYHDINDPFKLQLNTKLTHNEESLNDRGLVDFSSCTSDSVRGKLPKSELYLDPYGECTCGYDKRQSSDNDNNDNKKNHDKNDDDNDSDDDDGDGGDSGAISMTTKEAIDKLEQFIERTRTDSTLTRSIGRIESFNVGPSSGGSSSSGGGYSLPPTNLWAEPSANNDHSGGGGGGGGGNGGEMEHQRRHIVDIYNLASQRINIELPAIPLRNRGEASDNDNDIGEEGGGEEGGRRGGSGHGHKRGHDDIENDENCNCTKNCKIIRIKFQDPPRPPKRCRLDIDISDDAIAGPSGVSMATDQNDLGLDGADGKLNSDAPEKEGDDEEDDGDEDEDDDDDDDEEYVDVAPRPPTPHPEIIKIEAQFHNVGPVINMQNVMIVSLNNVDRVRSIPLRRLSLRGYNKITNLTLNYINGLDLDILDLTYTDITKNAIMDYKNLHPDCRIVHEQFCVCPTNLHF